MDISDFRIKLVFGPNYRTVTFKYVSYTLFYLQAWMCSQRDDASDREG